MNDSATAFLIVLGIVIFLGGLSNFLDAQKDKPKAPKPAKAVKPSTETSARMTVLKVIGVLFGLSFLLAVAGHYLHFDAAEAFSTIFSYAMVAIVGAFIGPIIIKILSNKYN